MNRAAGNRLKKEEGASLAAALLFFVLCGVAASVILAAASATAGKMEQVPKADQKRFAVESAAAFLRDELMSQENIIKIKEIQVENEKDPSENSDEITYYIVGRHGNPNQESTWTILDDSADSLLMPYIRSYYTPLNEAAGGDADPGKQKLTMSVSMSRGTQKLDVDKLQTRVEFSMDSGYGITALVSDTATDETHKEDLCQRKLTVPASVQTKTDISVERQEERDADNIVVDEWTITTTTRLTTIQWQRGMIGQVKQE